MTVDPFTAAGWYAETCSVDTITADGGGGGGAATLTTHAALPCWTEEQVQIVRGADGQETTSTATLHLPPTVTGGWFTPGSPVRIAGKPDRTVIRAAPTVRGAQPTDGTNVWLT